MVFSIISKPYNECEFCFFDNVFVGIIQLLGNNARKNSDLLPVKKDRLLLRPQLRIYRNDRGGALYILDSGLRRNDEGLLDCLVTRHPPGKEPGSDRGDLHPPSVPPIKGGREERYDWICRLLRHTQHAPGRPAGLRCRNDEGLLDCLRSDEHTSELQ